ncbi:MAG: LysR family transcriptional regulator [Salaquimonas sp.]
MNKNGALSIDFGALKTLCIVYAKQSFSGAAEALDINQSTVSYTIERLRVAFGDPLFVRQSGGITATPRCDEIVAAIEKILNQYESILQPEGFNPLTARADLKVSSNYLERVTILPLLIKSIRKLAPEINLKMLHSTPSGLGDLKAGRTDLLLIPETSKVTEFYQEKLFTDHYVCVMDPHNALAKVNLTKELYCKAEHALIDYGGGWRSLFFVELEKQGYKLREVLSIPTPENLIGLLAGTDMVATIPSRIAKKLGDGLLIRDCPFPSPFNVSMFWTARTHQSEMHRWLRALVAETATRMPGSNN